MNDARQSLPETDDFLKSSDIGAREMAPLPKRRSAIILILGTPGGMDRQMEYFTSLAPTALPNWTLTTFETHVSTFRSIVTLPVKLTRFAIKCVTHRFNLCHVNLAPRGSTIRKACYCAICDVLGLPYVLHLHGSNYHEFFQAGGRTRKAFIRRLFRRAASVIVLGEVWRRFVHEEIGIGAEYIKIVPNAVPGPRQVSPLTVRLPPVILFLGAVGERKGVDVLLSALAHPVLEPLSWTAVIAGDGKLDVYKRLAAQLGLAERVSFPGLCDENEVHDLLGRSTILVLPSRAENLPLSLLEGMAYGLCPIATPVGAVREVITDGTNGILVPVGDAPALALAFADVLADTAKCARLAAAARKSYEENYDVRHYPARLEQVYHSVAVDERPRRSFRSSCAELQATGARVDRELHETRAGALPSAGIE